MPTKSNIQRRLTLGRNSARSDSASPAESSHTGPTPHAMNRILRYLTVLVISGVVLAATACVWEQPTPIVVTTSVDPILPTVIPTPVPDPDVDEGRLLRLTRTYDSERNPSYSPSGDKIVFECYDDGWLWNQPRSMHHIPGDNGEVRNWPIHSYYFPGDICVMNADGSGRIRLTDDQTGDADPAWSPDGNQVIFSSCREAGCGIYAVNTDGSGLTRITDDELRREHPTWSPDGAKIAFSSWSDGNTGIFVMNTDGSNLNRITNGPDLEAYEPAWSPDGNRIAFAAFRTTDSGLFRSGIYVTNPDGTEQTLVYETYEPVRSPDWSLDSKTIAFASEIRRDSSNATEIYIVNVDGSGLERLTYRPGNDSHPTWSPLGTTLAFVSSLQGNPEIYVISDFRSDYQRLTDNTHSDFAPAWSPDGTRLAFVSDRDLGQDDIFLMNADGTGVSPLPGSGGLRNYGPAWSPDGSRIAFHSGPIIRPDRHYDNRPYYDIWVFNEDGPDYFKLTSYHIRAHSLLRSALSWSPDGTRLAFASNPGTWYRGDVINADGTQQVNLNIKNCESGVPFQFIDDTRLAWSPDGTRIAFSCRDSHIHIMTLSDGTQTSIWACPDPVSSPAWSPDGTRIAFTCRRSDNDDIFAIDLSNGDVTQLTFEARDASQPAWSPDGTKIAFASNRDGDYEIYVLDLERAP